MKRYKLKQTSNGIKVLWIKDTFTGAIVKEESPFVKGNLEEMRKLVNKLNNGA